MNTYARPELLLLREDVNAHDRRLDEHDRRLDEHDEGQGKILRIAQETFNAVAKVDAKLEKYAARTNRRLDSHEDLETARELAETRAKLKRLQGLPAKVAKWAGWGIATALGLEHLWRLFHP